MSPCWVKKCQYYISAAQTMELFTEALYKLIKYKALVGYEEKEKEN